jgi:hypothetical protein
MKAKEKYQTHRQKQNSYLTLTVSYLDNNTSFHCYILA